MNRAAKPKRDRVIDGLRGIGIVLVVLGHAILGVSEALHDTRLHRFLVLLIYSTHMPLFFILSGNYSGRMCQLNLHDFLKRISARLIWPYVLWSFLLLTAHFLMSGHTNSEVTEFRPWTIVWSPPAVMWFLYVLMLCHLTRWLLRGLPNTVLGIFGAACLALPYCTDEAYLNLRFIGVYLIAASVTSTKHTFPNRWWLWGTAFCVSIASGVLAFNASEFPPKGYPAADIHFLPMMIAGPYLLLSVTEALQPVRLANVLEVLGQNSMAIYVTHIFAVAGTRIILVNLGVTQTSVVILGATLMGVGVPLGLSLWVKRRGFEKALGW